MLHHEDMGGIPEVVAALLQVLRFGHDRQAALQHLLALGLAGLQHQFVLRKRSRFRIAVNRLVGDAVFHGFESCEMVEKWGVAGTRLK